QWTLDENVEAFERLGFSPTIFNRPLKISTSTSVLSTDISFPVVVSPVGAQAINPGGESAAAAAASQKGTAIGLSSWSADSVEQVVAENANTFFQLYWVGTRDRIERRVNRAREAGAKALIVTLDWSHTPRRDGGVPVPPPKDLSLKTLTRLAPKALSRPGWITNYLRRGRIPELKVPNLFMPDGHIPYFGEAWSEFEQT